MHPYRRRVPGYGVMLLFYQMLGIIGINSIPPVTLTLVGLQVAIFLRLFKLPWHKLSGVCISFYNVVYKGEYSRLLFSALEHVDDWHLYYNMISFILKGQSLERRFGSLKFLYITAVFTVLSNVMYLILARLAGEIDERFETQCAVGFSGVLFALKMLTTYFDSNDSHYIMGLPILIPARYAVWAELILIQILVPNVSFLGHLAGALVGLAYVMGPLKLVMNFIYSTVSAILHPSVPTSRQERTPQFEPRAEPTGHYRDPRFSEYIPPGMSEEEQLRQATEASLYENSTNRPEVHHQAPYPTAPMSNLENIPPPPPGLYPDLSEMRRRRLEHFQH